MNALKISMIDMLKIRGQSFVLLIFLVLSYYFMVIDKALIAAIYMIFGGVIFSMQPFMLEQAAEAGFLNLLPFSLKERVRGRYTFGLLLLLMLDVFLLVIAQIYGLNHVALPMQWYVVLMIFTSAGLVIIALEYVLFFAIGKFKSQQVASIVMMIPGFILFFGGSYVVEYIGEQLPALIEWGLNNMLLVGTISLAVGIVVWAMGIGISYLFVRRRDMS